MPAKTASGIETQQSILAVAAAIASVEGLDGLTLGRLAAELRMSKSGLFAHFNSKEALQLATIEHARCLYVDQVIRPGLCRPRGVATLYGLCDEYVALMERGVFPGGCFFAAAMAEFDARPGPVRDAIAALQRSWLDVLARAGQDAIGNGEFRREIDPGQLAFEVEAAMLSGNWYFHLFSDPKYFSQARRALESAISTAATPKGRSTLESLREQHADKAVSGTSGAIR